ncbi:MAG: extracellular solute-binding protein, partial [Oscillospiraceae bacterium]|nr:extracellular solute-binding protein [Oscillospiraceae bacterium]
TLFNIRGAAALQTWDAYALPLDGTAVMDELTTAEYSLVNRAGETKAIPWLYETAGLVVNRALLEEAGYTLDMLNGFDALRNMAVSIHDRKAGLNFDAFTSVGMDRFSGRFAPLDLLNTALFCELRDGGISEPPAAISGTYLDRFRALWNVWIIDSPADVYNLGASTGARAEERFAEGGAVFYPSGSWAYRRLTEDWGMAPGDLAIVPFYCGVPGEENAGLSTGSENRWAVNANAPEADREAALAFLAWCASSEEGLRILSGIGDVPFRAAPATTNAFTAEAAALRAAGRYNVAWVYGYAPNLESWTDSLRGTLIKYSAAIEDVNWADVTAACVDGWQIEYAIVNG